MMEMELKSLEATVALGKSIGAAARAGDLIALDGELGAGKTQLVRGIAEGMGLNPRQVSSPTYVLMQEYEADEGDGLLVHIDAYRLNSSDELESAGLDAELRASAVLAVEWASRVPGICEGDWLRVSLEHVSESERAVTLEGFGRWAGYTGAGTGR